MKKTILASVVIFLLSISTAFAAVPDRNSIQVGTSVFLMNGNGYGGITMIAEKWDAGIIFRSQAYEKANGLNNTSLFEIGVKTGFKQLLNDGQTLGYGLIWTLLSGKKDGNDLTGGTAFAPYLEIQQKMTKNMVVYVGYIPFYSATYASNAGDIKETNLNMVSAGFTYIF